jgi:hypothetical protein
MTSNRRGTWWTMGVLLSMSVLACALVAQQTTSLIIHGQQGDAKVVQVQGHNYVDIEGLARLTNGTLSFRGNQIVLTLPSNGNSASIALGPAQPSNSVSKDFRTAGVEAMARLREWHAALRIGVEKGVPLATGWLDNYQAQAQDALRMASVAISTDGDRTAYPVLINEYNNMKSLNDKYVGMTTSMNYIDPSSLQSDPLNQKVVACSHFLSSIASTQAFIDDGSCR